MAQGSVFEQAEELLGELLGISISAKQIQRVSEHYGAGLEQQILQQAEGKSTAPVLPLKAAHEVVYVLLDGSMIFTRRHRWKEIKMGRLFKAASRVPVQADRTEVLQSL